MTRTEKQAAAAQRRQVRIVAWIEIMKAAIQYDEVSFESAFNRAYSDCEQEISKAPQHRAEIEMAWNEMLGRFRTALAELKKEAAQPAETADLLID